MTDEIVKFKPKRGTVAMELIDEILSYTPKDQPPREPGEIDPIALKDEYEDYPFSIDPEVYAALAVSVENMCRTPLDMIPPDTPGYEKGVAYLKQFEL